MDAHPAFVVVGCWIHDFALLLFAVWISLFFTIQLLTNIGLLKGPEIPPFFSLSTLTSRHSPLRTAERAQMPETALLSAFMFCFRNSRFLKHFFFEVEVFAFPMIKAPVFWEYCILPGHRLLSLHAERSSFSLNEAFITPEVPA